VLFDGRDLELPRDGGDAARSRRRSARWVTGFFVSLFALAAFLSPNPVSAALSERMQNWLHPPSLATERMAADAGLTPEARSVFFASSPSLEPREQLAVSCSDDSPEILGCYTSADGVIHVISTSHPLLPAVEAGVAGHEVLHAIWSRMSETERFEMSGALRTAWTTLSRDPRLEARMAVYSDLDEAGFTNELHSVLATEVQDIGPELEAHYARYFVDRAGLASRTTAAFDGSGGLGVG
jgi:hypothetical protein